MLAARQRNRVRREGSDTKMAEKCNMMVMGMVTLMNFPLITDYHPSSVTSS